MRTLAFIKPRITPTSVGRSGGESWKVMNNEDYPHQCGEKQAMINIANLLQGLPPPVWGEVRKVLPILSLLRITPTSVGRSQGFDFAI